MVMPSMRRVGEALADPGAINAPMSQKRDPSASSGQAMGHPAYTIYLLTTNGGGALGRTDSLERDASGLPTSLNLSDDMGVFQYRS